MGEPHCIPRRIAYEHHATYNSDSGNDSRNAHIYQFLERKVQSHREQQKNDTDVRPYFDIDRIGNSRDQGNGRTRHNTGYNVTQYDRLLQPLKMTVTIPAIIRIMARSDIKGATSDMLTVILYR